jgi:hypothetical protein
MRVFNKPDNKCILYENQEIHFLNTIEAMAPTGY